MATYYNIDGWMRLTGQSSVQAQATAEDWLQTKQPKAAAFHGEQHVSDFMTDEWAPGRICLEDRYGVFHVDPLGKVAEIASVVFEDRDAAVDEARRRDDEEEHYNAGPDYNPSWRRHGWTLYDCDARGIPLDSLCPTCLGDRRYCCH